MARALRAWAINRGRKNSVRNLRYGPQTRLVRGISAADIAFIMCSTSAWLLSPLECSPRNKMAEGFSSVSEDELCEKCIMKQLLNSVFA